MLKAICSRQARDTVRRAETNVRGKRLEITMVRMHSDTMSEFLEGSSVAILLKPCSSIVSLSSYGLSPKEVEVAMAIVDGKSIQQIADHRRLSRETVRTQLKSVFSKLGVTSQLELVRRFKPED
jgi:DNA-binding CsgD family transcriptional regulator